MVVAVLLALASGSGAGADGTAEVTAHCVMTSDDFGGITGVKGNPSAFSSAPKKQLSDVISRYVSLSLSSEGQIGASVGPLRSKTVTL